MKQTNKTRGGKDKIRARLIIYGMGEMSAEEFNGVKRWLNIVAQEMKELPQKAYAKNPRWTIYQLPKSK